MTTTTGGGRSRPAGMGDVAALAGVSHQTVSRVLNGSPHVREATRDRVRAAMATLDYRPNLAARALVTRRSGLLGVLATGLPHLGPSAVLAGIETAARAAGFTALVGVLDDDASQVDPILTSFAAHRVDGIAVIAPYPWLVDAARAAGGTGPVLVVADAATGAGVGSVGVDQAEGARAAVTHLVGRGLTDIAHLSGPPGWIDAERRVAGWADALGAAGLPRGRLAEGDWSAECGHAVGRAWIADGVPQAIFCANDVMALGLLAALREAGVRVPEDVSVVGFDDMVGAAHLAPALTTVRQPFAVVGSRAVAALLAAVDGGPAEHHTVTAELVVRASTR
ncbi:LacI family DNA-binding transcriptional regulator [Propioniciclava soli]|uniref:LacI family DNA-binding transcriptional regulator n=1 Tax=Propioniciclava soli TaxID=2775081 RepID=A0ABZ3CBF2_9ACTN